MFDRVLNTPLGCGNINLFQRRSSASKEYLIHLFPYHNMSSSNHYLVYCKSNIHPTSEKGNKILVHRRSRKDGV